MINTVKTNGISLSYEERGEGEPLILIMGLGAPGSKWEPHIRAYTRGLFESIPKLDGDTERLVPIEGTVPNPANLPTGCCFHPRCKHRRPECETQKPGVKGDGHTYKCYL
ncbi:hypothetical protein FACS1894141_5950 [Spirochaetia bacterium]|nr:hypothetical protein FACS1894141_5950 [Spirochaetia bacterium]